MKTRALAFVLSSILLTSCTFTPHEVAITAEAPSTPSSVGKGVTLALQVIDDRDDVVVGQRGVGMMGADITVKDIVPALERELKKGLEVKGFTVASAKSNADAKFKARLRAFKFFIETGFWTGAENTSVVINVEADKRGKNFERSYRFNAEERVIVVPMGSSIDEKLNAALSEILAKIMLDAELMNFLAQ